MYDESPGESLGMYLRRQREQAGLNVRQLAERADVDHAYVVRLENSKQVKPSADILQRLAEALQVDFSELLPFIGVKPVSLLPSVRTYFRRKLGVNADEAEVLARLIEKYRQDKHQSEKGGEQAHDPFNEGGGASTD
jgi:transcriptional regulator with XRE-family HTH domain